MKKVTFKVESFRRIPCPFEREKSAKPQATYIAICNVKNLPSDIPMDTNPREQNLRTNVALRIKEGLIENRDCNFHLLNRGLVISAEEAKFNNDKNLLTLTFTDSETHGDIDGGHTYKIILNNRDKLAKLEIDQFVRLEILTGIEDFFEDIASARNTSMQVKTKSIAELEGKFDIIKDALDKEPFLKRVSFKEYAPGEIDVREVIAILTMFNIERFNGTSHPIVTYSQKETCINHYLQYYDKKEDNPFRKLKNIAPDIFKLYNHIEKKMPEVYKEKEKDKDIVSRYGRIKGVAFREGDEFHQLLFSPKDVKIAYGTPKGFIYPVVAAFRALVEEDEDTKLYKWFNDRNPIHYFNKLANDLVNTTIDRSRTLGNNPNAVGKDTGHWAALYDKVAHKMLAEKNKRLEEMLKSLRQK